MLEADPAFWRDPVHMTWPAEPHLLSHLRFVVRARSLGLGFSSDTTEDIVLAANEAPKRGPALRGFGLRIMRQLIDTAAIHPGPAGTTVLLRHPLPRATPV
jgi:hypothetical protein